jgi:Cys-rich protein (TIGR01571 family)
MLAGLLLLGFAGTLVVLTPSSIAAEIQQDGERFLQGARRLAYTDPVTNITHNSSFDSSQTSSDSIGSGSMMSSIGSSRSVHSSSGSLRSSGARVEGWISGLVGWMGSVGGQVCISLLFACLYHKNVVATVIDREGTLADKELEMTGEDDFANGICGCFDDKWVCIHGLCCPLVRMAHTNAVAGVCGFWETAIVYLCCALFTANLGPCCLMIYWRKQVKEVMGIEDHLMNDICCTFFFPLLSLCQQSTAVDREMGYEVTGCCTLKKTRI